jgi:hypothetical protein
VYSFTEVSARACHRRQVGPYVSLVARQGNRYSCWRRMRCRLDVQVVKLAEAAAVRLAVLDRRCECGCEARWCRWWYRRPAGVRGVRP